jgi:hypothetical protein
MTDTPRAMAMDSRLVATLRMVGVRLDRRRQDPARCPSSPDTSSPASGRAHVRSPSVTATVSTHAIRQSEDVFAAADVRWWGNGSWSIERDASRRSSSPSVS